MTVSITIRGIPELQRKLGQDWVSVLRPPMQRSLNRIVADMSDYPPARPGSKYIRGYGMAGGPRTSERYGQRWTTAINSLADGLEGKAGNNASYAPFVGSKRFQARIHRDRWATDEDTIQKHLPAITRDFQAAVDEALR